MDRIAIARRALNNTTSSSRCSFLRRSNVVCCNRNTLSFKSTRCAHPSIIRHQFSSLPTPSNSSSLQSKEESNNELTVDPYANLLPIDYTTSSVITGEESQILEIQLKPNQMVRAESGAMLYMTDGVHMETSMGLGGSSSGGLSAGLTRMMTGQNLMVSDFTYTKQDGSGTIALGTDFPAKILRFSLDEYPNAKLVCQKGAYLAGSHSVAMEMAYTKNFSSGFFGGEGFILQSLQATNVNGSGDETVFLKAYGTVVKKDLKEGETLRVSSGSLVCMTSDIDYDVSMMPGFKNVMFGGEGLFVTTLTGPGSVWLQGMPVDRMVSEIARHIPSGGGIGLGIPIGMGGGGGGEGAAAGDMAVGEAAAGELVAEGGEEGSGVPLTEDAVDADRNATVASSGMESSSDPDSSESLFGDAAFGGESTPEQLDTTSTTSTNEDSFSSTSDDFSNNDDNMNMPEFEEPNMTEEQFEDDGTTFSTYDEGSESTAGDTEGVDMPTDEEGSGLLGQLWDMFRDFTDDD